MICDTCFYNPLITFVDVDTHERVTCCIALHQYLDIRESCRDYRERESPPIDLI